MILHLIMNLVNCQWGDWTSGSCSKSCGSGVLTKSRIKTTVEAHGANCSGQSTTTEICNDNTCPGKLITSRL